MSLSLCIWTTYWSSEKNREQHIKHLELVLSGLKENKLYVGESKCHFMTGQIEFLGLNVSSKGVSIDNSRIDVVQYWPKHKNIGEIRSFIVLLQYLRRFIHRFSDNAAPLTYLTRKGSGIQKCDRTFDEAFICLKKELTSSPILTAPDWSKPFCCHIDANQFYVGGTLTQKDHEDRDRVVAYFIDAQMTLKKIIPQMIVSFWV